MGMPSLSARVKTGQVAATEEPEPTWMARQVLALEDNKTSPLGRVRIGKNETIAP